MEVRVPVPAAIPKQYEPGRTIGVDVVYFPGVEPNETIPVLNVSAEEVWWKFMRCWGRVFGRSRTRILRIFAQRVNEAGSSSQDDWCPSSPSTRENGASWRIWQSKCI